MTKSKKRIPRGKSKAMKKAAKRLKVKVRELKLKKCKPKDLVGYITPNFHPLAGVGKQETISFMDEIPVSKYNAADFLLASGRVNNIYAAGALLRLDDPVAWNMAVDYVINQDLRDMGIDHPALDDAKHRGKTTKAIYEELVAADRLPIKENRLLAFLKRIAG